MQLNEKPVVAVSDNRGVSWKNISDVGAIHGIKNTAFPAVVAGDNLRAAMAFYGSKTAGNPNDLGFDGFWHLYIAHTYDGGATWSTVDATPNDPIQRGGIWLSGGSPIHRNLLDFFDATIDAQGRVLVGYDDGCAGGACMQAPDTAQGNSFTAIATIARQTGGRRLFASFDPPSTPTVPGAPFLTTYRDGPRVRLEWSLSDDGGAPVTSYKVFRRSGGVETLLARVGRVTSYEDTVPDKRATYSYRVVALNSVGESCGSNEKSAVTQQSASPQPSPSSQKPASPASGGTSNVQGEQKPETTSGTDTAGSAATTDACNLITKSEIEAVQGEPVSATKSSSRASGSFTISQCFYTVATFHKSVSLELTRSNTTGANQTNPKDFWKQRFHGKAVEKEGEKEGEEEGEKEAEKPRPVNGVGDEAFWTGNSKAGALYVLKNNAFIRISLGGADDETVKINKAKTLAQKALGRF